VHGEAGAAALAAVALVASVAPRGGRPRSGGVVRGGAADLGAVEGLAGGPSQSGFYNVQSLRSSSAQGSSVAAPPPPPPFAAPAPPPNPAIVQQGAADPLFPVQGMGLGLEVISTSTFTTTTVTTITWSPPPSTTATTAKITETATSTTTELPTTTTATKAHVWVGSAPPTTTQAPLGLAMPAPRTGRAGRTTSMKGHQCANLKDTPPPSDFPDMCSKPWGHYLEDESVKKACSLAPDWERQSSGPIKQGGCRIDPDTKEIICNTEAACSGGKTQKANVTKVSRVVQYNCGTSCHGALRVDCCSTCRHYADSPLALEVDKVTCLGCEDEEISEALRASDCVLVEGAFHCQTRGRCATGTSQTTCEVSEFACDVVQCSSCDNEDMKAQCCSQCLKSMCDKDNPERLVCEGCDTLPGQGGPQWFPR